MTKINKANDGNLSTRPGPGSYEIENYKKANVSLQLFKDDKYYINYAYGQMRYQPQLYFASKNPRFNKLPSENANLGPGQYETNIKIERESPKRNKPILCSVLDKRDEIAALVGPGTYNLNYSQVHKKSPAHNICLPLSEHNTIETVGPGTGIIRSVRY